MINVTCPVCGRKMQGQTIDEWPQFPMCSPRCRLIDLGRWLGGNYRIPSESEGEADETTDNMETP
ncbi:MAG: DNA gyrase inhibitor YacG [Gemmataceae bacterium]|nr:DNA gyrase inhibitor YacG [Gemmataceae bacterium]